MRSTASFMKGAASRRMAGDSGSITSMRPRMPKDLADQSRESRAHGFARSPASLQQRYRVFGKRQAREGLTEQRQRDIGQRHIAHGTRAIRFRRRHVDAYGTIFRIEDPGVVDFREVVIFGRKPEDRDRFNTLRRQFAGDADCGQSFVESCKRGRRTDRPAGR